MSRADHVAHEHAYRLLKAELMRHGYGLGYQINIARMSETLGVSRTPIREALFRLVGEGIVQPADHGGYQLFRPTAPELHDLYMWNAHLVLNAVHVISQSALVQLLEGFRQRLTVPHSSTPLLLQHPVIADVFQAFGDSTGNSEISRHIRTAGERLSAVRRIESQVLGDTTEELPRLLLIGRFDVRKNVRRKILTYHRRRLEQSSRIAALVAAAGN
ncbi:GntR family transcriptional regulator [Sphingobium yanoikuyae]|jgi:hypothetical protein|uniref:GntR family transcriptional regulator n=1 Tax=Sphingobium yanoikuyae TaxID=13690 RepID=UPI0004E416EC|nr:GntR family transcriptional regulator [Sphingobium yanoikuyae]KFD26764.1 hypothetical protein IH86_18695 [Sphingobium yanoikuyae]MDV3482009.1 GntR family transcriptional regulator [Sphingobium yanoikuyae]